MDIATSYPINYVVAVWQHIINQKYQEKKKGHDRQVLKEGTSKEEKSNIYGDTTYTESNRNNNRIV